MTQDDNATELLTCPGCGKQISPSVTVGKADSVTLACPQCKERFPLSAWRASPPPEVKPVPTQPDQFEQFPMYREFYGNSSGKFSLHVDSIWGLIVGVSGFLCVLSGAAVFAGSADDYSGSTSVIAELQGIRGVLMLILGGKMISWGNKHWNAAAFAKSKLPN